MTEAPQAGAVPVDSGAPFYDEWPKSFEVHRVRNTFDIVAHSEDQARMRFDDLQG